MLIPDGHNCYPICGIIFLLFVLVMLLFRLIKLIMLFTLFVIVALFVEALASYFYASDNIDHIILFVEIVTPISVVCLVKILCCSFWSDCSCCFYYLYYCLYHCSHCCLP